MDRIRLVGKIVSCATVVFDVSTLNSSLFGAFFLLFGSDMDRIPLYACVCVCVWMLSFELSSFLLQHSHNPFAGIVNSFVSNRKVDLACNDSYTIVQATTVTQLAAMLK